MNIPLRKAPEVFFDRQQWADFIAHFESREIAMAQISRLPSLPLGFYQEGCPSLSTSVETRNRQLDELFVLGTILVGTLKNKLINNQIIATGVSIGLQTDSGGRALIPPELWRRLWPNFIEDKAMGELFGFTDVTLSRNDDRKTRDADIIERCVDFLIRRSAEGESRRKILELQAHKRFGDDLTTRDFATAYKTVFKRSRGRPRIKQ